MAIQKNNPPKANILMNSMRSMGYSFESALADVIDNSISANARNIQIIFPTEPTECYVSICDDGYGMSADALYNAMKYGCDVENGDRTEYDLGRFGLGLKSASLSQCRNLTVASKVNGKISAYVWDLDFVEEKENWAILELDSNEIEHIKEVDWLKCREFGTLVIWEKFDIIEKATGDVFTTLDNYKERSANYLSLIFHRFINDDKEKKIKIKINNYELVGLDPFLEKHKKTNPRKEIQIPIEDSNGIERYITVKPYILPFQKDLSKEDIKKIGGIENSRTKQGFYIYRNQRLIIWGTWFGLPKNELTKNARIKVDIPNKLDDIWEIDIKKQNATIPRKIRTQLTRAVEEAMELSIKSQAYRGRIQNVNAQFDYVWNRIEERDNKYLLKINRNSKIFEFLKGEDIDDSIMNKFEMVLEEIENTVPYQQIYIDMSGNKIADENCDERIKEISNKAEFLLDIYKGMGSNDIKESLDKIFLSEPFCKYPSLKQKLLEEHGNEN